MTSLLCPSNLCSLSPSQKSSYIAPYHVYTSPAAAAAKSLRRTEIGNTDKHVEPWECSFTAGRSEMGHPPWKKVGLFLVNFSYYPAVLLLGLYPNELKRSVHTETCTQMFITALFRIAQTWQQLRCPSVGEWINKL